METRTVNTLLDHTKLRSAITRLASRHYHPDVDDHVILNRLRKSNPGLKEDTVNAALALVRDFVHANLDDPVGSPQPASLEDLWGCFDEKFLYSLVSMILDPKLPDTSEARILKFERFICRASKSINPLVARTFANQAEKIRDMVFDSPEPTWGVASPFSCAEDIKKTGLGLSQDWAAAFDELVLKPVLFDCLVSRLEFNSFDDFWAYVVGTPSDMSGEDAAFWAMVDGGQTYGTLMIAERFLRIKDLLSKITDDQRCELYECKVPPNDIALINDLFWLIHDLVNNSTAICMQLNSPEDLLKLINKTGLYEISIASRDLRKRMQAGNRY